MVLAKKKRDEKEGKKGMKKGERKKRKRERKKEGVYKKRRVRKEGSESEPASSTHIKGCLVCTPSSCGITL